MAQAGEAGCVLFCLTKSTYRSWLTASLTGAAGIRVCSSSGAGGRPFALPRSRGRSARPQGISPQAAAASRSPAPRKPRPAAPGGAEPSRGRAKRTSLVLPSRRAPRTGPLPACLSCPVSPAAAGLQGRGRPPLAAVGLLRCPRCRPGAAVVPRGAAGPPGGSRRAPSCRRWPAVASSALSLGRAWFRRGGGPLPGKGDCLCLLLPEQTGA